MDRTMELIKLAQEGDTDATQQLVKENTGLIWSIVKKFVGRGYDAEDLYQIGAIGLLKCISKFDISYGVKFSTYAVPVVMGEIKRFLRDDGIIKVSRPLKELAVKAKYSQDMLAKKNGRQPTITELAQFLEVSVEDLVVALDADKDVESLYASVYSNDGNSVLLIDKYMQKESVDEQMIDTILIKDLISKLKPRERQVIFMRYFQDKTQSEIAKEIGVSQVQVSRIEKKVIQTMRMQFQ